MLHLLFYSTPRGCKTSTHMWLIYLLQSLHTVPAEVCSSDQTLDSDKQSTSKWTSDSVWSPPPDCIPDWGMSGSRNSMEAEVSVQWLKRGKVLHPCSLSNTDQDIGQVLLGRYFCKWFNSCQWRLLYLMRTVFYYCTHISLDALNPLPFMWNVRTSQSPGGKKLDKPKNAAAI